MKKKTYALDIAFLLLNSKRPLSTNEITSKVGCDRKTVYLIIDAMEEAGFCTKVTRTSKENMYEAHLRG